MSDTGGTATHLAVSEASYRYVCKFDGRNLRVRVRTFSGWLTPEDNIKLTGAKPSEQPIEIGERSKVTLEIKISRYHTPGLKLYLWSVGKAWHQALMLDYHHQLCVQARYTYAKTKFSGQAISFTILPHDIRINYNERVNLPRTN